MFIPFLPLILAALALSLVVFEPSRSEGMIDLSLFQYAGILLSGSLLLAQVTLLFKGRFISNYRSTARNVWNSRINHSRVLTWVLWYVLLYTGAPDQRIQAALPVVAQALDEAGLNPEFTEVVQRPASETTLEGEQAEKVVCLIEALEELEDVQDVFTNASLPEEMQAAG